MAHLIGGTEIGSVVWLVAFCIRDEQRFRRLLRLIGFVAVLVFVALVGWWLAHGGMQVVEHLAPARGSC